MPVTAPPHCGQGLLTVFTVSFVSLPCGVFTRFTSTSVNAVACALLATLTVGGVSRVASSSLRTSRNCPSCRSVKSVPPLSVVGLAWLRSPPLRAAWPGSCACSPVGSRCVCSCCLCCLQMVVAGLPDGLFGKKSPKLPTPAMFPPSCKEGSNPLKRAFSSTYP